MADNSFKIVARLDIPQSASLIEKDIKKLEEKLQANNTKVNIIAGLDIIESKKLIQTQLNSLSSQLDGNAIKVGLDVDNGTVKTDVNKTIQQVKSSVGSIPLEIKTKGIKDIEKELRKLGVSDKYINGMVERLHDVNMIATDVSKSFTKVGENAQVLSSLKVTGVDEIGNSISYIETFDRKTGEFKQATITINDSIAEIIKAEKKAQKETENTAKAFEKFTKLKGNFDVLYKQYGNVNQNNIGGQLSDIQKMIDAFDNTKPLQEQRQAILEIGNAIDLVSVDIADYAQISDSSSQSVISATRKQAEETAKFQRKLEDLKVLSTDKNASKFIDFSTIEKEYSEAENAITNFSTATQNEYSQMKIKAEDTIATLERQIKLEKNRKYVATSLRDKDYELVNEEQLAELEKFENKVRKSEVASRLLGNELKSLRKNLDDMKRENASEFLTKFLNEFDAAKSKFMSINEYVSDIENSIDRLGKVANSSIFNNNSSNKGVINQRNSINELIKEYKKLIDKMQENPESNFENFRSDLDKLRNSLDVAESEANHLKASLVQGAGIERLHQNISNLQNRIEAFRKSNPKAEKQFGKTFDGLLADLKDCGDGREFQRINKEFQILSNHIKAVGLTGNTFFGSLKENIAKFSGWMSMTQVIFEFTSEVRKAIIELKDVDTLLTEISKANDKLTDSMLKQIGNSSFDIASKYGKQATDYLSGVQEASRAGYENAEEIAELSVAIQGAGDVTEDVANSYVIATDKAYKLGGSIEELTKVFDGTNKITNLNAVNMSELAEAMTIVGSTAASFGIEVDETTAAIATMSAVTQQSGSEVARAFRAILLNIRQVSDEEEGIDAEGLTKYEAACNALGVSLKETKDGVLQTRDAMEVLKELSVEYNKLSEDDLRRTNLLNSVGGKLRSTQLDALLRNWDTYETMIQQYADGSGSMAREAEKTAKSLEGSLNRLSNTWTDTVENVLNADDMTAIVEMLNGILNFVNSLTEKLGTLGTIGLGAGIFAGIKNVGRTKMYVLN